MNNIYKVIWSKAKNCYVVASEIAKSHTKSASGSEKMGGYGKKALLALAAASAIFCGGLVNVGATVRVNGVTDGANEVYTTTEVNTELGKKANADSVYTKGETYTKDEVNTELGKKANADSVYTKGETYTKDEVNTELGKKANADSVYTKGETYTKDEVNTELGKKANADSVYTKGETYTKDEVNTELGKKANADSVYTKGETYTKDEVNTELGKKADANNVYTKTEANGTFATSAALNTAKTDLEGEITTAKNELDGKITANTAKITANEKAIQNLNAKAGNTETTLNNLSGRMVVAENNITNLKDADVRLEGKIDRNAADITNINEKLTTAEVNIQTNTDNINALDKKVGTINNGTYLDGNASVADNLGKLDAGLKQEVTDRKTADDALSGRITANANTIAKVNQELVNTNNHFNTELRKTNDHFNTELRKTNDHFNTELRNTNAALQATNKRTAGIGRTDTGVEANNQTVIEDKVHFDQNGNVSGVKDLQTDTIHATGGITTKGKVSAGDISTGTLETTGNAKIVGDLTVDGKLNVGKISMKNDELDINGDQHHSATTITADGISNNAKVTDKNGVTTESKFTHDKEGSTTYAKKGDATDWKESTSNVTADGVENVAKDSKGNNNTFTQTSTDTKNILKDKDGNTSTTRQDSKGIYGYAKDKDGNKSYTKQEGNRIAESVIGQDGKQTKSEMTSTDITNTAKDGTITSDAKDIVNKATGNISNSSATMDTTVTGKATESYGELETEVKGNEKHTVKGDQTNEVDGKQINTIKNGQENIISGGQTNTITGGQINNITGDQTTTITGNKTETVTENVTEDYKKNLTTTVGGNEIHEVKGTKTETVEGKLTENFKGGQETNVTGDQTTNVSGTQTTTATDINRNASGGMIDTIDNDYGTNTETKVAGKTTTDVSIKGTGEKGQYIRGANESRDYLIKGTLKNSETKTAEATSTEITDGTNKASTIQDAKNLAGSVTNGTETGVSGIHANNDGSVSIDSSVAGGGMSSVINQKKDSIQSAVGDGTNSTVIHQDKDNVTIASSNGMVGLVGKDIVNNAQNTITNTAGTKITDTAGDSTVTTENGKGTTFTKTGSTAYREGGPTDTNISGNTITTGKVTMDYADVMKDLGVHGNAKIDGKTTTGSLEVTGTSTLKGDVTMESNATIKGDVTAKSYNVDGKTYIDANGIHANNQKITDVADGSISEGSKDAVNGGQLYNVKNDLEGKVNKVGANAAAMANLHPMEFDPDSKWNIAAAIGNYGSETAAALGAFYRPNDDVMVNLSTAFGTGENMVGGGVSVRLGKGGNKLSREESNALKDQVNDLTARMDALLSVLNPNMSKDFPDVPENHWAYEAVSRLAGNDIVQGYPDGEFHGERTMTRYEMAEIIYNALSRGAEAEKELVEEFKPELQAMAASEKATAEKAEG